MFILITNDDGYKAEGIQTLYKTLKKRHEVIIAAPAEEQSAKSHAVTLRKDITFKQISEDIYAIGGTPTDCVLMALHSKFLPKLPDMIISGINHGQNLGDDVTYSGTVGGAIEGILNRIPSFSISSAPHVKPYIFQPAADFALDMAEYLTNNPLMKNEFFNINVPSLPKEEIRGVKFTKLGKRIYTDVIQKSDKDEKFYIGGNGPFWKEHNKDYTDFHAVNEKYISVTPITLEWTSETTLEKLKKGRFKWQSLISAGSVD